MQTTPFQTAAKEVGSVQILDVNGRITVGQNAEALARAVRSTLNLGPRLVIDLSNVDYIDSTGVAELVSAYTAAAAQGGKLKLLKPQRRVATMLELTRVHRLFEIFQDESEALASFKA